MKIFKDIDLDLSILKNKTVAVLGFGSQGNAQAKCMKDSGLTVIIGLRKKSQSIKPAKEYGFNVMPIFQAVKKADIVHVLLPDQVQALVYEKEIAPFLTPEKTLSFSHGFNIVFGLIKPPKNIDVFMIAPHSPGQEQRKLFLEGKGVPGLFAVHQNPNGNAKKFALAMSKACGFTRVGVYECSFEQETFSDLFGEQAVLCGGLSELVQTGFDTLLNAGFPPHVAFFACLYEVRLTASLLGQEGIEGMWKKVSDTAEYGGRTMGPKIINASVKKTMKSLLENIQNKKFAHEWITEYKNGLKNLNKQRKKTQFSKIEKTFKKIKQDFNFD